MTDHATRLRGLPAERAGRAADEDLAGRRAGLLAMIAQAPMDPAPEETTVEGVRTLVFRSPQPARGTYLHFHGGGYRLGCPEQVAGFAAALAKASHLDVVCPAYRLAPEHPFPNGASDGWRVYQALRAQGAGPIVISGDSAGGGLAATVTAVAVEQGVTPAGAVLLSPWLDLTVTASTYEANAATDPLFSRQSAETASELYLQGLSPKDPLASPLFGPVEGFPPTLVSIGEGEVLAEDGRRFQARLRDSGVDASLLAIPGMEHCAVARSMELTGSAETFAAITAFIDKVIGG